MKLAMTGTIIVASTPCKTCLYVDGVLLAGLTDEADVRPVHPRLLITLHLR